MFSGALNTGLDAASLRRWLLDEVCPFWSERIVDPAGGYFEGLNADGRPVRDMLRTVLVQARLTYVFSHAFCLGRAPQMRAAADHGFKQLQQWSLSHGSGWAKSQSTDGTTGNSSRDTYDQAFVIFACAWHFRATGKPEAIAMAESAYEFLRTHVADQLHGGFFEEYPELGTLPRRQNPHMHLLEATLAMFASTAQQKWLHASSQLVALFKTRFFDQSSGSLGEFFNAEWSPCAGVIGELREPGHQFEWVWLLAEFARLSGDDDVVGLSDQMFDFGQKFGLDNNEPLYGLAFDAVNSTGKVTADSKLFWPQTEYIKACVARWERGDTRMDKEVDAHLSRLRTHYFRADGANWRNQLTRRGNCLTEATPSRVLYHLFLAFAETIRVKESLEAGT